MFFAVRAFDCDMTMILVVRIDRLLAVLLPLWYKTLQASIYIPLMCLLPIIYTTARGTLHLWKSNERAVD